ncbi:MAG TPA: YggS family pyridoxal phosphate-dependent enzyme [Anaerolineaceae bacterium]|nr:YggS family pyridoxal phosphate-dependent enzyme [Anaerolineaceae bacterium]HPN51165.1 YggS family pyridoxal phosphate-dependent enzyme [Anaerolineaceae bacterium]
MEPSVEVIFQNIQRIKARIEQAAAAVNRDPESVRLVVVTKTKPADIVENAIQAGAQYLGESYAEEAVEKINLLRQHRVEWHMIGHIQSRKARLVAQHFDLVHSLDSLKLAYKLDQAAGEAGKILPVLIEVNIGGEESKQGWQAGDDSTWPALAADLAQILQLKNLNVKGMMTMPPLCDHLDESRRLFRKMVLLQYYLRGTLPQSDWQELSMGTSGDFEAAIMEGATYIRIGEAIVGPRQY